MYDEIKTIAFDKGWNPDDIKIELDPKNATKAYDDILKIPNKEYLVKRIRSLYELTGKYSKKEIDDILKALDLNNQNNVYKLAYDTKNRAWNIDLDSYFSRNRFYGSYGADQGITNRLYYYVDTETGIKYSEKDIKYLKYLKKKGILSVEVQRRLHKVETAEYMRMRSKLTDKGFTTYDADQILKFLDNTGACSYAQVTNSLFVKYINNPAKFANDFGFDMYIEIDGKLVPNYDELLVDLYIFANSESNGGHLFGDKGDGQKFLYVDENGILNTNNQLSLSGHDRERTYIINGYLKSKGIDLNYHTEIVLDLHQGGQAASGSISVDILRDAVGSDVSNGLKNNKQYKLGLNSNKNNSINMISLEKGVPNISTSTWNEGGGHAMFITSVNDKGFVVSSWGNKYLIPYSELIKGDFNIWSSEFR